MIKFERNNRIEDLLRNLVKEGIEEATEFSFIAVVYNEILNLESSEIDILKKNYGICSPIIPLSEIAKQHNVSLTDLVIKGTDALNKVTEVLKMKYAK